jgi:DNA (cytosine-5)-methyltransferase 1
MRIGSLFSGIGGLDLAAEAAFSARTIWHCEIDPHAREVLRARWPDAVLHDDVRTLTADTAEPIDVLTGGFPCQDLSVAGKRAGLDGARSGLYGEMLRIAEQLQPEWVVFENVPPLLKYRTRVEQDLRRIGYGSIWQVCEAADVGAPHRRQRVFVVARRGMCAHVMLPRPSAQRDLFAPAFVGSERNDQPWATPTAAQFGGTAEMHIARKIRAGMTPVVTDLRLQAMAHDTSARWPTPTVCGNDNRKGASATSGDGLATAAKWPTPAAADGAGSRRPPTGTSPTGRRPDGSKATVGLQTAASWPTPTRQDGSNNGGPSQHQRNTLPLNAAVGTAGVLNPGWVELLMGLPPGWTDPGCDKLGTHRWPTGRGEAQHPDEPPRLVPPKSVAARGARLKALGNAVVPQCAEAAIRRALATVEKSCR